MTHPNAAHVSSTLRANVKSALSSRFDVNFGIRDKTAPAVYPTGIPHVDLPKGTLTEIVGPPSSGRTGILLAGLARATQASEYCALIDASDSFDPAVAVQAGIDLNQLLWVRCRHNAEQALKAVDFLVQAGGFGVVVFDLAGIPMRDARRISLASWFRLRHTAEKTNTALVVMEEDFNARSCSALQVETHRSGVQMNGALLRGISVDVNLGPRKSIGAHCELGQVFRI